jgi:hypothetical protein
LAFRPLDIRQEWCAAFLSDVKEYDEKASQVPIKQIRPLFTNPTAHRTHLSRLPVAAGFVISKTGGL